VSYLDNEKDLKYYNRIGTKLPIRVRYDCCGKETELQFHTAVINAQKHEGLHICKSCAMTGKRRKKLRQKDAIEAKCSRCELITVIRVNTYTENLARNGQFLCKSCAMKIDGPTRKEIESEIVEIICDGCGKIENVQRLTLQRRQEKHGCNLCIKCIQSDSSVKEKRKETCRERYGGSAATCDPAVQEKRRQTCQEKYGVDCHTQNEAIKTKITTSMIERFGTASASQNPEIAAKVVATQIRKYGGVGLAGSSAREKANKTNLERYGSITPSSHPDVRAKCSASWLAHTPEQTEAIAVKRETTNFARYGVANTVMLVTMVSEIATGFLNKVQHCLGEPILRESWMGHKIKVDGFHRSSKTIIEFFGDFWHLNPNKYKPDDYHPLLKATAADIWQRDAARIANLESRGYMVIVVWEQDYRAHPEDTVEKVVATIRGRRQLDAV